MTIQLCIDLEELAFIEEAVKCRRLLFEKYVEYTESDNDGQAFREVLAIGDGVRRAFDLAYDKNYPMQLAEYRDAE